MPERYIGRSLGRFRIEALVGSGGFAWVFKGYDPELEIPVAIKVLKPQFAGDDTFESRFRREASIAARLRHPNIIRILAVGREDDAVYFVMDYLPNSLVERLKTLGTLPEPLLLRLGIEVASALAFAHREGVIHRDVKADNILFDSHGNAVVADFGIARAVSGYVQETGTNMVVGTPQYFSPEQARGLQLDGRADLYSLGVTLFKAATGTLPFDGQDWYEIARQHVEERPPKPRALNPEISVEMERIILKCIAKNKEDRFPSGEALAEALAALGSNGITDPAMARTLEVARVTPTEGRELPVAWYSEHRWVRRGVAGLGLGVAIAVLALAVARQTGAPSTSLSPVEAATPPAPDSIPTMPGVIIDSASDSASAQPSTELASLSITAPESAAVSINGRALGHGTAKIDSLTPGTYRVLASLPGGDDCEVASQSRQVTLIAGQRESVSLSPQMCGTVELRIRPATASFLVSNSQGLAAQSGIVEREPILRLAPGTYRLRLTADGCTEYVATLHVRSGGHEEHFATMDCRAPI